ncbi:ergothioneine biosynthesis protein EgtB [Comamonas sp.]|uniref:ergothioneine biosynthesis protein EgtB n=1 Tax=Comamonas sp. TaxID=34028 RepID=UPI0012D115C3|nr:ergothioneine biosynthesis protein EgtB [Comamonas sp.]MPS95977.1 ergothioneine biosynthesis protein EgtB [Comamonas sp.]
MPMAESFSAPPIAWDWLALAQQFERVRACTQKLAESLSAEDACVQSMPDASPAKWHLAHTSWFFETFVLAVHQPGHRAFDESFRMLFNSYYQQVGERHPRAQRGLLTRPALSQVMDYRAAVDEQMLALMAAMKSSNPVTQRAVAQLVTLGLQHEQQHQELLLTDIKHLLSCHPLWPAYAPDSLSEPDCGSFLADPGWQPLEAGIYSLGHGGDDFAFDNELPRHSVYVHAAQIASRPVNNGEFLRFVQDGGYRQPQWWLAEGWDWCQAQQLSHPWYWRNAESHAGGERWQEFSLYGVTALHAMRPVSHLSYFEADAYARWAGARLPSEVEWEVAMGRHDWPVSRFGERGSLHPEVAGSRAGAAIGQVWEWTQSSYAAYPGFRVAEGAVGEYNGKFMVNQYVLRGGSCLTPAGHARLSYRNFFPATARWQMTGLRLARDA